VAFPALKPTARDFDPGDWPVKTYNAQSGAEIRILYGDTRTQMKLSLNYDNISDTQADLFLSHYNEVKGTYNTFDISTEAKTGWTGATSSIDAGTGNKWRYADPPQVTAVRPGRSSVRVNLVGVF
jgi:hypothetical protein